MGFTKARRKIHVQLSVELKNCFQNRRLATAAKGPRVATQPEQKQNPEDLNPKQLCMRA